VTVPDITLRADLVHLLREADERLHRR
jgi:hypothetical protein